MSQLPAVELLVNLGWEYLTPAEAMALRGGRRRAVVLEDVLRSKLREINAFNYKGKTYPFGDAAIEAGIDAVLSVRDEGLVPTNHRLYDLLTLGKSTEQTAEGKPVNPQLRYFDWDQPENNVYQLCEEFEVEREGSHDTLRPDIVLFVNGIPLGVIECKSPLIKDGIGAGISQHIRNQKTDGIPRLFWYAQLLFSVNRDGGQYGATGASPEFWSDWHEDAPDQQSLDEAIRRPLPPQIWDAIESVSNKVTRHEAITLRESCARPVTGQDRLLHSLCRPERFMEMFRKFIVFDAGRKKIARYQQYFAIHKILRRVLHLGPSGSRDGGVVWHTQGSGKSLTMVMLAKNLALHPAIQNPRLVLVTDRVDLDKQIRDTFADCGLIPKVGRRTSEGRATTGRDLKRRLERKDTIVTAVIDKFENALKDADHLDDDPNVFVLVDESHRSQHGKHYAGQFGTMHKLMRKALPNACYIGFTGTPLMKAEKNTARQFGGLIDTYTIDQAVSDKAVLRLLYEGRLVEQDVSQKQIDEWFERITRNRSEEQKLELKKKFATAGHLHKAEQRMRLIAWDVSTHFEERFKGSGLKGQFVADSRLSAIRYRELFKELGLVTCEVVISKSDDREDHSNTSKENETEIQSFWDEMMNEHGSEEAYQDNIVARFKGDGDPDIVIVCSKLLTGFDAPRNTVLYLDRALKEHTLLQAIARVNRKFPGKDFGYIIDYRGILGELDKALETYGGLGEFDEDDLDAAIFDISTEIARLADHHAALKNLFQKVRNPQAYEEYVEILRDEAVRDEFVERLRAFARTLEIALSSMDWTEKTPAELVRMYRDDLKFFEDLRRYVRQLLAKDLDYKEYAVQMQKLIDRHVGSNEVRQITPLVDIFDKDQFDAEVEKLATPAARADTIAHRTARTITERMDEDPVFYQRLSVILRKMIADYQAQRIAAAEYLKRAKQVAEEARTHGMSKVPPALRDHVPALAFYNTLNKALLGEAEPGADDVAQHSALALEIDETVRAMTVVDWQNKPDVQNAIKNALEDRIIQRFEDSERDVPLETIDFILDKVLQAARHHYPK
ncbi:MAG: type I restriction endonuclease subunit R [Akkermansiaceae bacterium]|nr:type I restriction endonuclease subunit R [Akkermansiaceae bacterium]